MLLDAFDAVRTAGGVHYEAIDNVRVTPVPESGKGNAFPMSCASKMKATDVDVAADFPTSLNVCKEPIGHPNWIYELKHDGFRGFLYVDREEVIFFTGMASRPSTAPLMRVSLLFLTIRPKEFPILMGLRA